MTNFLKIEFVRTFNELSTNFRGLDPNDLNPLNPEKSCVLCAKADCPSHNIPRRSCDGHVLTTEIHWLTFYDFYKEG